MLRSGAWRRTRPNACSACPEPLDGRSVAEARAIVVEGLQACAATAREAGVALAFEPAHRSQHASVSFVNSILDAVDLLDEAGLPEVGLLLDLYHVWDDPTVWDFVGRASYRIAGVHVADWPAEEGRTDRVLPGEGVSHTRELVAALALSGWDGYLDVEIFSDRRASGASPSTKLPVGHMPQSRRSSRRPAPPRPSVALTSIAADPCSPEPRDRTKTACGDSPQALTYSARDRRVSAARRARSSTSGPG